MAGKQLEKEESKLDKLKQWFGVKGPSAVKVSGRRRSSKEYVLDPHVTQVCFVYNDTPCWWCECIVLGGTRQYIDNN